MTARDLIDALAKIADDESRLAVQREAAAVVSLAIETHRDEIERIIWEYEQ